ncbi:PREDICTED: mas-related G-protein coupled receptor member X1-like [Chinchilla lanigera]|uniref:mas-related G-protein coupled receptor member X1-like n=1 Tax=Chinchilla lanigera TaxID=34839 RepID=UPI00038EF427|nr:PREDICTED: mas-related G-protein coupled receptor member X1-like [Chinchilla lanigera]
MQQVFNIICVPRNTSGELLSMNQSILPNGTELTRMDEFSSVYIVFKIQQLLTVIFALIGLPGNAAVIWLLGIQRHKKPISVYILHLATSDFLFLCCLLTFYLWKLIDRFRFNYYIYIYAVGMIFYVTSLLMLSAISTERCLAVLFPIWYHCHRPRHMSAVLCSLFWALSLLLTILLHIGNVKLYMGMHLFITSLVVILSVLLCGSNLVLLVRMLCGSTRLPLTRLYVTIGLTVLVFLLCSLPLYIMSLWGNMIFYTMDDFNYMVLWGMAYLLSSVNSSANPIIYFFVGSFRQKQHQGHQCWSLKAVLQKALEDEGEGEKSRERLPQESVEMS